MFIGLLYNSKDEFQADYITRLELIIQLMNGFNLMTGKLFVPVYIQMKSNVTESYRDGIKKWKTDYGEKLLGIIGGFEYNQEIKNRTVYVNQIKDILVSLDIFLILVHPTSGNFCESNIIAISLITFKRFFNILMQDL